MAPKVFKQTPEQKSQAISEAKKRAEEAASQLINFSLKYLDIGHGKFLCFDHDKEYYQSMASRMKDLCSMKKMEFMANRSSALRIHPIKWEETSEKSGFGIPGEEQIVDTPYQFSLSSNENGRIHGFFILSTFYIVWIDKDHQLYSKKN